MQRLAPYRHIPRTYLIHQLKEKHGTFEVMRKHVLNFSTGTYKAKENKYALRIAAAAIGLTVTFGIFSYSKGKKSLWDAFESIYVLEAFQNKKLQYSLSDVAAHSNKSTGIWVTYNCGVYDITDYVENHPGGDNILMAAGGSLEPYWVKYPVHKQPSVLAHLERYKIGILENCVETDAAMSANDKSNVQSSLKNNIPDVDPATYRLKIECPGASGIALSLDRLRNSFPKHTVKTALKCAGNCKGDKAEVKTNEWTGARLIDVLHAIGFTENHAGADQIQFEGLDLAVPGMHYGTSVPFEKAIDPSSNIILAYELNGRPLSKDNGFPVRVLMPGIPAGRQVKWLGRIIISKEQK